MADSQNQITREQKLFRTMMELQKLTMDGYKLMSLTGLSNEELCDFLSHELLYWTRVTGSTRPDKIGDSVIAIPIDKSGDFKLECHKLGVKLGVFDKDRKPFFWPAGKPWPVYRP